MNSFPRLALSTPAAGPEPSTASLAWLAGLRDISWRVQHFRSRACPTGDGIVGQVTGLPGRHLDSWLMPDPVLRSLFARGAANADLSLVEGTFEPPAPFARPHFDQPGRLHPLVEALDLPTIAVLPCPLSEGFHLPRVPEGVDAIFLDGLKDPADYAHIRRMLMLTTKTPVVGAVEDFPEVREALRKSPRDRPFPAELLGRLSASFRKFADLPAIRALANSRPISCQAVEPLPRRAQRFRVAYAQDTAFGAYFPDTLEALEALGAELVEFSPLHDERLPAKVDLVMIGCGFPDEHADALAENFSLMASLRSHLCGGQRIYAEGGGTAYLGRYMILDGRRVPGVGIFPFDAERIADPQPPSPVERTLSQDCWLGPRGTVVRGYLSGRWRLSPVPLDPGSCPRSSGTLTQAHDVYFRHHAVGGLIHLHLGALREVVSAFAGPHHASLTLPSKRS